MAGIQGIYLALFGRPADPAGAAYYNNVTKNGTDLSGIGNLAGQKEYLDRFAGMTSSQIVQSIYQSLFGRAAEQTGIDFWVDQLTRGALSINTIAIAILDGATGSDRMTADAKIAAADLFTSHLDQPAEQSAYTTATADRARAYIAAVDAAHPGTAAAVDSLIAQIQISAGQAPATGVDGAGGGGGMPPVKPVSIVVLDADHVSPSSPDPQLTTTAGADEIRVADAYHAVGKVDGGDGMDKLIVAAEGNVTPTADNISHIETLELAPATQDATIDLTHVEGLQEIRLDGSSHGINVNGLAKSVTAIGLEGTFSKDLQFALSDASSTDDTMKFTLKNATVNSDLTTHGVEHIVLDVDGSSKVSLFDNSLKTVTVTGNGDLNFSYVDTLNQTSRDRTIDLSHHEGSSHFGLNELEGSVTFIGGSGDDFVSLSGANQVLTGGGGTNTFDIGSSGGLAGMNVITDFNPLMDYLIVYDFTNKVTFSSSLSSVDRARIAEADTVDTALAVVASITKKDDVAFGSTMVFAYGKDTYVYTDRGHDGLSVNDGLLKITGVSTAIDPYHLVVVAF